MTINEQIENRMELLAEEFTATKLEIQKHEASVQQLTSNLLKMQGEYEGLKKLVRPKLKAKQK